MRTPDRLPVHAHGTDQRILVGVSTLNRVPPAGRRKLGLMLLPLSLVLLVAGGLPATVSPMLGWKIVGVLILGTAIALLALVVGLRYSARTDEVALHEAAVDAAILATSRCGGGNGGDDRCALGDCTVGDCAVRALPRS